MLDYYIVNNSVQPTGRTAAATAAATSADVGNVAAATAGASSRMK